MSRRDEAREARLERMRRDQAAAIERELQKQHNETVAGILADWAVWRAAREAKRIDEWKHREWL